MHRVCVCLRERGGIFVFVREELEVGVNVYSCIPRLQTTVNSSMCHLRFLLKFFCFVLGFFCNKILMLSPLRGSRVPV